MIKVWEVIDKAVKKAKRHHKDIILNFTTRSSKGGYDTTVQFNVKKYNRVVSCELSISDLIRKPYPEDYLDKVLEDLIRMVK